MTPVTPLRIAIVGAGPGGATLARLLQMQGYAPAIFERETSPLVRRQGGSLDLHLSSGLEAVRLAGLDAQFQAIARYQDQGHRILDKAGTVLWEDHEDQARPEVDRSALRTMLLDSLAPNTVRWGCAPESVRPNSDGTHTLMFQGQTETFDLVVGADGAWSRVRTVVSPVEPVYTGVSFVELGIDDVDQRYPEISQLVGRGSMTVAGGKRRIVAQRNGHDYLCVYVTLRASLEELSTLGIDVDSPSEARSRLRSLLADYSSVLLHLIDASNDAMAIRSLYMLPVGYQWEMHSGVTLLGDAAHLMSPFAGQGVNMAMQDAVELAQAICEHSTLVQATCIYEQKMFMRAKRAAELSAEGLRRMTEEDTPESTVAYFQNFTPA